MSILHLVYLNEREALRPTFVDAAAGIEAGSGEIHQIGEVEGMLRFQLILVGAGQLALLTVKNVEHRAWYHGHLSSAVI
ncbi:MAG: hypothetical protein BWY85_02257 [Firmicutes bacterium ADurb.Bin506]|nr:MAG: hypothetical protein BWY85_02257 [Firmicutes bacterium ADurb.Bin506]